MSNQVIYIIMGLSVVAFIIIAIASVIGCLIHIENLDINGVITAVITAVGGVGTAVVAYDAKNK